MSADQFPCVFAGRSYELFRKTDGPGFDCVATPPIEWHDLALVDLAVTTDATAVGDGLAANVMSGVSDQGRAPLGGAR